MFIINNGVPFDLQPVEYGNHDHHSRQEECAQDYCYDIHQSGLEFRRLCELDFQTYSTGANSLCCKHNSVAELPQVLSSNNGQHGSQFPEI